MKFAVVVSRYNQSITQNLLSGALGAFAKEKIKRSDIRVSWVPGAFEIPVLAAKLARSRKYAAVVCLGCVLQGKTPHNRYISNAVASGLMQAMLASGIPITFGVLTPDTMAQARERSGKNSANKGTEAALAALEIAKVMHGI